jgi:hypothetical protein
MAPISGDSVLPRRRAGAADVQLGLAKLLVAAASSGGTPCRRTGEQTGGELGVAGGARLSGGAEQGEAARAHEGRYDALNRAESAGPPWRGSQRQPAVACRVLLGHRRARAQMGSAWAGGWASGGRREIGSGLRARPGRVGFLFFSFF